MIAATLDGADGGRDGHALRVEAGLVDHVGGAVHAEGLGELALDLRVRRRRRARRRRQRGSRALVVLARPRGAGSRGGSRAGTVKT